MLKLRRPAYAVLEVEIDGLRDQFRFDPARLAAVVREIFQTHKGVMKVDASEVVTSEQVGFEVRPWDPTGVSRSDPVAWWWARRYYARNGLYQRDKKKRHRDRHGARHPWADGWTRMPSRYTEVQAWTKMDRDVDRAREVAAGLAWRIRTDGRVIRVDARAPALDGVVMRGLLERAKRTWRELKVYRSGDGQLRLEEA